MAFTTNQTVPGGFKTALILPVLVIVLGCVLAGAQDFTYTTTNGTVTITGYTGTDRAVVIPGTINGLPVTSIGTNTFLFTTITSVTIPNSVTNIGDEAFAACYSLTNVVIPNSVTSIGYEAFVESRVTSVTIPDSVTSIGDHAFEFCLSLTSVTIGSGVISIGSEAFDSCYSLTNIMVDSLNSAYSSMDGVLFNKSQTIIVVYPAGKARGYMIPTSVTSIGAYAFANCWVTSVTIPNGVTSIEDYAFANCYVTSATIPNRVTSVQNGAFSGCTNLTHVTIANSVTSIGDRAFFDCPSLTSLYYLGNTPSLGGTNVFSYGPETNYYLPGTVGWGSTFGGRPTAVWTLPYPLILSTSPSFGVRSNQFGFTVSWATNLSVVVEACSDLASPVWSPLTINALSNGVVNFTDPERTNYPSRFYRVRSQ